MNIKLKNKHDIKHIKKAIKIGERILDIIPRYIKPGITSKRINKIIEFLIFIYRAKPSFKGYKGFPTASCISVNEDIIHGVPNGIPLKDGDIVKIDIGIKYKGYYSDQARTYFVGDNPSEDDFRLVKATQLALDRAIDVAVKGNYIGDISHVIEQTAEDFKLGILKDYAGHGVGFDVHEEPKVPNVIGLDEDVKLVKGMVLAIEPMFVMGKGNYIKRGDWNIEADGRGAHFERTVIIQ